MSLLTTYTLRSVNHKVKSRIDVPVAQQRMLFQEKRDEEEKDAATLESYGVQHLDTLLLYDGWDRGAELEPEAGMIIFILTMKDWDNHKFHLTVESSYTILNVKQMIEECEGIPVDTQRLTFKRQTVNNSETLQHSKIQKQDRLTFGS